MVQKNLAGVSVIVPTFMRAEELDNLLFPSLDKQKVLPFETIIIDDTPNESVKTVCSKWGYIGNPNSRLLYRKNVYGKSLTIARNYGVSEAKGDFLMFLDSDIVLDTGYIKAILDVFSKDPYAAGVQGYISNILDHPQIHRVIQHEGKLDNAYYPFVSMFLRHFAGIHMPSKNSCRLFEYPVALDRTLDCEWLSGSNFTIQREFFKFVKFDSDLRGYCLGEDALFSNKLKRCGKIYITPFARCKHLDVQSGTPSCEELKLQKKMFFLKMFGPKGLILYFNKMAFMKLAEIIGL